jgi:transposase
LKVKEVLHEGDRYIICLNPQEAERDRQVREEILAGLAKKLKQGPKQLVGNRGYRRYLDFQGTKVIFDEEKIASEARFDGKYVLKTNTELTSAEVAQGYKSLWQVERAFRELKTGLNLRPVYHFTDARVRGHIMVCFLALVLESALCRKLKESGTSFSYSDLVDDLKELRAVEVTMDNQRFLARTEMMGQAYEAFKALGIRPPNLVQVMPSN